MLSRVSDIQVFSQLTENLDRLKNQLREVGQQVTTGQRVNKPSDDPAGASAVVRSLSALESLSQDERALSFGRAFLGAQDGVLDEATHMLTRAREIAVQQANGTISASERATAAIEVHQLLEAMVAAGNAELGGRRLFSSGEDAVTGAEPFLDPNDPGFDPASPYNGSTTPLEVQIGIGRRVRVTTPGGQVFGEAIAGLADLEARLLAATDPTGALPQLEQAATNFGAERASIGTRMQRIDERLGQVSRVEVITQEAIVARRDVDLIAAVSSLTALQTQLQVAAAASQNILEASLVNLAGI